MTQNVSDERSTALANAQAATLAAVDRAASDVTRPRYHFCAPAQWMNDPNGTLYHDGWYHLFYQCNPYGDAWATMHWGHARSRDMIHWQHLPIALWPSSSAGEDHCYSGCMVPRKSRRPAILYTSIGKRDPQQWLAEPQDDELITWDKHPVPVLTEDLHPHKIDEWRDPFVFDFHGRQYLAVGGKHHNGQGTVALYEPRDEALTQWSFKGTFYDAGSQPLECPNLLVFGDRVVLICSPYAPPRYWVGAFDPSIPRFTPAAEGPIDLGSAYATNTLTTPDGRQILFAWVRGFAEHRGWSGCIGVPREVSLSHDGRFNQVPIREITSLRGQPTSFSNVALRDQRKILVAGHTGLDIEATFRGGGASRFGLALRCDANGAHGMDISCDQTGITVGDIKVDLDIRDNHDLSLRILLDQSVVEVFINGGQRVVTKVIYPQDDHTGVAFFASEGAAELIQISLWPMDAVNSTPVQQSVER